MLSNSQVLEIAARLTEVAMQSTAERAAPILPNPKISCDYLDAVARQLKALNEEFAKKA